MPLVSLVSAKNLSGSAEQRFGKSRTGVRCTAAIVAVAKKLWPVKTAFNLGDRAGVGERAAEKWMQGPRQMSLGAVRELLETDNGYEILTAIMKDSNAQWWFELQCAKRRIELRREMDKNQREMRALGDE